MQRSKYKPGERIKNLQEMMNQDVIFVRGKPVNKGFFKLVFALCRTANQIWLGV